MTIPNSTPPYIAQGDCLELMRDIPDKSVDMVLCDLPYGVLNKKNPNATWDKQIPIEPLWEQYERIIKDNGAIVLFAQGLYTAKLMFSNSKMWRYNLVWDKCRTTGFLNAKRMPLRSHEDICVFYKKLPTYNPQMSRCAEDQRNHSRGKITKAPKNNCYGKFAATEDIITDYKYPRSIISIPRKHKNGEWLHPSEKPVDLLRYLVRTYTTENEIVLDNCMGSGSTCVAAIKEKRKYIGIELDEKFFNIAKERIDKEISAPTLF